jgi:hypothetical protein
MGAMRFVKKHCNEAVHLRRQLLRFRPAYAYSLRNDGLLGLQRGYANWVGMLRGM